MHISKAYIFFVLLSDLFQFLFCHNIVTRIFNCFVVIECNCPCYPTNSFTLLQTWVYHFYIFLFTIRNVNKRKYYNIIILSISLYWQIQSKSELLLAAPLASLYVRKLVELSKLRAQLNLLCKAKLKVGYTILWRSNLYRIYITN